MLVYALVHMYLVVICLINYHSSCNLIKEYKHTHIKTKTKHVCFVFKFPLLTFYPAVLSPSSSHQTIRASQMPLCLRLDVITPLGTAGQKYKKNKKQNKTWPENNCCAALCVAAFSSSGRLAFLDIRLTA